MRYGMRRWRRAADRDMHIHEIMTWCCGWHNRAPTVAQLTIKCRPLQGKVTYRRRVKPHHEHVSFDKWGVRSRDRAGKEKEGKVNPSATCVPEHPIKLLARVARRELIAETVRDRLPHGGPHGCTSAAPLQGARRPRRCSA